MNENERERMLETLFDLLDIPEAENILLLKAGELERIFSKKLADYRNLKNQFHKTGYDNLLIFKNKKPVKKLRAYSFELKRVADRGAKSGHKWVVDRLSPEPDTSKEEVIPPEFFRVIDNVRPDADRLEYITGLESESLGRKFDITYTRRSKVHVIGNIRQHRRRSNKGVIEKDDKQNKLAFVDVNPDHYEDYLDLYRCMEADPFIREHMFSYFHMVLKPSAKKVETIR
jgi:hypothetical protein